MILGDVSAPLVWVTLFLLGSCVGSFLNVCIARLPAHEDIWKAWRGVYSPPSHCPSCQHPIRPYHNIPIFGWLWLRGRCRDCRFWIPIRYPAIELFNGVLWVVLYVAIVPTGWNATVHDSALVTGFSPLPSLAYQQQIWSLHLNYVYLLVLVQAMVVASFIDLDLQIIPDSVTVPSMIFGLLGSLTGVVWLLPVWVQDSHFLTTVWSVQWPETPVPWWWQQDTPGWITRWPVWHGLSVSLAGLLVGGGVVWFFRVVGAWILRREAMGFGDVTLMAMIGCFLGWQAAVMVFFLAPLCAFMAVLASFFRSGQREIPYGPYLSLAALFVIVGWKWLLPLFQPVLMMGPFLPVLAAAMAALLVALLWMIQTVKWWLGWPLEDPPELVYEWTSADQLTFFASKDGWRHEHRLSRTDWPGVDSGRGLQRQHHWLADHGSTRSLRPPGQR
jgi:leader peptidase (prepilin peptidase) / N-methyltransferase